MRQCLVHAFKSTCISRPKPEQEQARRRAVLVYLSIVYPDKKENSVNLKSAAAAEVLPQGRD